MEHGHSFEEAAPPPAPPATPLPVSLEVEQALLGAILLQNEAFYRVSDFLEPAHFYNPLHRQIFACFAREIPSGRLVDPKVIRNQLGGDPQAVIQIASEDEFGLGIREITVADYIETLALEAVTIVNAEDYGRTIADLALKRRIIDVAKTVEKECRIGLPGESSTELRSRMETSIEELFTAVEDIGIRHVSEITKGVVERVDTAFKAEKIGGIPIGLKAVQDLTGPLLPGRLYMIGGSPGSGKSLLAAQIAELISAAYPVLYFQIEMPGEEQIERMLSYHAGLTAESIERAALDADGFDRLLSAAEKTKHLNLWIDSSSQPSVTQIRGRALRLKRRHGLSVVVIDHLLYMASPDRKMRDYEAVRFNLQGLKRMAKDLHIAVVVLNQPTKESSGASRPLQPSDLFGGSAVEQEADVILLLFREEYMLRRAEPRDENSPEHREWREKIANCEGRAEVSLGKRRGGAGYGHRKMFFDANAMRFYDNLPSKRVSESRLFEDIPA